MMPDRIHPLRALRAATLSGIAALVFSTAVPAQDTAHQDSQGRDVTEAVKALESGDYVAARRAVEKLLVAERSAAAVDLRVAGRPMEAIEAADAALSVDGLPRDARASLLMARGRAAFAAAASDVKRAPLYEEALANFEEAARIGAGVAAAFRASRSARMIGDNETALKLARAGAAWVNAKDGRAIGLDLDQSYTRTLAEAAFSSYLAAPADSDEDRAAKAALFEETKLALEQSIGLAPTDTWAYLQLSNLYQWESRGADSLRTLEAALAVRPANEAVHTAFVRVLGDSAEAAARAEGADDAAALQSRFDAILNRYDAFRRTYPKNALGFWYGGFEQFYDALNQFELGSGDPEAFAEAESLFASCRDLNAAYEGACVDYEILSRSGRAWTYYQAEENEKAIETFFSCDVLRSQKAAAASGRASGLELTLPGAGGRDRLPSALAGLDFVTRRFIADPTDVEALTRAAEIGDAMFSARPENANLANNAGFLNRDAGVLWETRAQALMADENAAEGEAAVARARGQALMEKSWAAYQVAARLLPDDVRVVNDAGLVMAYYLRTDVAAAEAYFLDSVKDGGPQLESTDLGQEERDALNEAWGDAHQNMGILEMTLRQRPAEAKAWFEKALEIGPPSRDWLKDVLPLLDTWIETGNRPEAIDTVEARSVWAHNPPPPR
ncbi:MAG: hypothetical protein AAGG01_13615 [Planctomycetota bacterium]